jgi:hypothetical protein
MASPLLTLEQMDMGVVFYHQGDEQAFFDWPARIPCVAGVAGEGRRGAGPPAPHVAPMSAMSNGVVW